MKEQDIQTAIMKMLLHHPRVAWCYVTTSGKVKGRGGHWMTLGVPGLPDIMGQLRTGHLFGIECKQPGNKPTEDQERFIDMIRQNGGLAGVATSVDEALEVLR